MCQKLMAGWYALAAADDFGRICRRRHRRLFRRVQIYRHGIGVRRRERPIGCVGDCDGQAKREEPSDQEQRNSLSELHTVLLLGDTVRAVR